MSTIRTRSILAAVALAALGGADPTPTLADDFFVTRVRASDCLSSCYSSRGQKCRRKWARRRRSHAIGTRRQKGRRR